MTTLQDLLRFAGEDGVRKSKLYEPMSRHTTILCGGPAQFWLEPSTFKTFSAMVAYCRERGLPHRIVGRGSNLRVPVHALKDLRAWRRPII